jgi:dynein heavy chain
MDWYNLWPREALYSVATRAYTENAAALDIKECIAELAEITVFVHNSVTEGSEKFYTELRRYNYTTPTSYLELVKTFVSQLMIQKELVPQKKFRYEAGLKKLAETNVIVKALQENLIVLRPEIDQKEKDVTAMVEELKIESAAAGEQEKITAVDEAAARKVKAEVMKIQNECKAILDEAMPALNKAIAALDTLKAGDISEIKMYQKPKDELIMVF